MARPLVTVTDPEEAKTVSDRVEIVDVKNPEEGSLGCPRPGDVEAIRQELGENHSLSLALGDFPHAPGTAAMAVKGALEFDPDYVKIGIKESGNVEEAEKLLEAASRSLEDSETRLVAAAYADHEHTEAASPAEVVAAAERVGVETVMIDTLRKDSGNLFDHLSKERLDEWVRDARSRGLETALAGSLEVEDVPELEDTGVDIIGARGSLCSGGRDSSLDPDRLEMFLDSF